MSSKTPETLLEEVYFDICHNADLNGYRFQFEVAKPFVKNLGQKPPELIQSLQFFINRGVNRIAKLSEEEIGDKNKVLLDYDKPEEGVALKTEDEKVRLERGQVLVGKKDVVGVVLGNDLYHSPFLVTSLRIHLLENSFPADYDWKVSDLAAIVRSGTTENKGRFALASYYPEHSELWVTSPLFASIYGNHSFILDTKALAEGEGREGLRMVLEAPFNAVKMGYKLSELGIKFKTPLVRY